MLQLPLRKMKKVLYRQMFKNLSNQQFEKHAKVTKFDIKGLVLFIVMIASISFVITQGYKIGWLSAITSKLILAIITINNTKPLMSNLVTLACFSNCWLDKFLNKNKAHTETIVSVCALFLFKNLSNQQFEKHAKVTKFDIKGLVLFIVMIASISFEVIALNQPIL